MPDDKVNPNTGLPHTVSLGSVLSQIRLAPHEIASLLARWGADHQGSAQAELTPKLHDAASAVLNPRSYGLSGESKPAAPAQTIPAEPRSVAYFENLNDPQLDAPSKQYSTADANAQRQYEVERDRRAMRDDPRSQMRSEIPPTTYPQTANAPETFAPPETPAQDATFNVKQPDDNR